MCPTPRKQRLVAADECLAESASDDRFSTGESRRGKGATTRAAVHGVFVANRAERFRPRRPGQHVVTEQGLPSPAVPTRRVRPICTRAGESPGTPGKKSA